MLPFRLVLSEGEMSLVMSVSYDGFGTVGTVGCSVAIHDQDADLTGFSLFVTDGFVSLPSDSQTQLPVKIFRDTASKQFIIPEKVLPFSERSPVGSSELGKGFEKGFENFPLHNILTDVFYVVEQNMKIS